MVDRSIRPHGGVRGADSVHRSLQFEGRFGRMFRTLPAAKFSHEALKALGKAMVSDAEDKPTPETEPDPEENSGISAGYTYLGQFIDHDLTFDPASALMKANDPNALVDYRTPRFDLDNLYGRGPADQPYLYEPDGQHLQLGRPLTGSAFDKATRDLPRHASIKAVPAKGKANPARALIGDPRNDENVIVSQLQGVMLRFHNKMLDDHPKASFEEIQRLVRWHYQYVVVNDFLPTIVGRDMVSEILPHIDAKASIFAHPPRLRFFKWKNDAFIPIEFTAAAYRFGHSMVRPQYRLNTTLQDRFPIFDPEGDDNSLTGFREFPSNWAIDWSLFFDMGLRRPPLGPTRVQPAYKIDTSLVNPLGLLPHSIADDAVHSLATRNLLRGLSMGLPSGQEVAKAMGETPIPDSKLVVGKASSQDKPVFKSIVDIPKFGAEFRENAPLWYYVLAEAQQDFKGNDKTPIRLGRVGGRVVAEVIIGLMLGDSHSFLSQNPAWTPNGKKSFGIADLIKLAIS